MLLRRLAKAALQMATLTREYISNVKASGETFDWKNHVVPDEWRVHLKKLLNLVEYIYTPAAVASGYRGAPHNGAAYVHMCNLDVPPGESLDAYFDTIECATSDFGVEMGTPSFILQEVVCRAAKDSGKKHI